MDFGLALGKLKDGHKLARSGWNGKGLYVFLDQGAAYEDLGELHPFFIIVSGKRLNTWVPSVSDILAEDWEVIG